MKLTISIPDEKYDELQEVHKNVAASIVANLDLLTRLKPKEPLLIFEALHLRQLSELFGGIIFKSPDELIKKLKDTQHLRVTDNVELKLTTDDLYQIKQQSIGMGRPYDEYFQDFITEAVQLLLYGSYAQPRR